MARPYLPGWSLGASGALQHKHGEPPHLAQQQTSDLAQPPAKAGHGCVPEPPPFSLGTPPRHPGPRDWSSRQAPLQGGVCLRQGLWDRQPLPLLVPLWPGLGVGFCHIASTRLRRGCSCGAGKDSSAWGAPAWGLAWGLAWGACSWSGLTSVQPETPCGRDRKAKQHSQLRATSFGGPHAPCLPEQ